MFIGVLLTLALLAGSPFANSNASGNLREIDGTGHAVMGERMTLENAKSLARKKARSNAASKLGELVESKSVLQSFAIDGEEVTFTEEDITVISAATLSLKDGTGSFTTEKGEYAFRVTYSATFVVDMDEYRRNMQQIRENRAARQRLYQQTKEAKRNQSRVDRLSENSSTTSEEAQSSVESLERSYERVSEAFRSLRGERVYNKVYAERLRRLEGMKLYLNELKLKGLPSALFKSKIIGEGRYRDKGEGEVQIYYSSQFTLHDKAVSQLLQLEECYRSALYPIKKVIDRNPQEIRYEPDELTEKAFGRSNRFSYGFGVTLALLGPEDQILAVARSESRQDMKLVGYSRNSERHRAHPFAVFSSPFSHTVERVKRKRWTLTVPEQVLKRVKGVKVITTKEAWREVYSFLRERGYYRAHGYRPATLVPEEKPVQLEDIELSGSDFHNRIDQTLARIQSLIDEVTRESGLKPGGRAVPCDLKMKREEEQKGALQARRNGSKYNAGIYLSRVPHGATATNLPVPAGELNENGILVSQATEDVSGVHMGLVGVYVGTNLTPLARHRLDAYLHGGISFSSPVDYTAFQLGLGITDVLYIQRYVGLVIGANIDVNGITQGRSLSDGATTYGGYNKLRAVGYYPAVGFNAGLQLGRKWRLRFVAGYRVPFGKESWTVREGGLILREEGAESYDVKLEDKVLDSGGLFFRTSLGL